MNYLRKLAVFTGSLVAFLQLNAQQAPNSIRATVLDSIGQPLEAITVSLLHAEDSSVVKINSSNKTGLVRFEDIPSGNYFLAVSGAGYETQFSRTIQCLSGCEGFATDSFFLRKKIEALGTVTVVARKPLVEIKPDKTIINVDASVTNVGATVLEVLEKSPGVYVDRNGTISLKGRPNVLVMIDGKPSYLPATELAALLGSMNAAQIETIEIISNPSAKYDAAGSTGIINIRTKKNKTRGFNGTITAGYGQGQYPKSNNNLLMNYRSGKLNLFFNYGFNYNENFTDLYALRKYYEADEKTVTGMLEQFTFIKHQLKSNTLKTGMDLSLSRHTTVGMTVTGLFSERESWGNSPATWMDNSGQQDSLIISRTRSSSAWKNGGVNFNFRHEFSANRELTADLDFIQYDINGSQYFENELTGSGGYTEAINGNLPSDISILSGKVDYAAELKNGFRLETGLKTSSVKTNNLAEYYIMNSSEWIPDYSKTNHFLYHENIHAAYVNAEKKAGRWTMQAGLRYEYTRYDATQQGNPTRKDSSFARNYDGLFPTSFVSYQLDSNNTISASVGRRIDRPAFQKLNPFIFLINKYTYQQGNPFFKPQYTWNFELNHSYKEILTTSLSYGLTTDYFSQIFYSDSTTGLIIYSEGNLATLKNLALSVSSQLSPARWWSVSLQATVSNRRIEGYVWKQLSTELTQINFNINNQFRFGRGWAAELSGFFVGHEQELQEITDPTGQISMGVSKQVLNNKGSIRFNIRDIFYTQAMKGNTIFLQATEYFKLTRDSRVFNIAFTYRFGKTFKTTTRKSSGAEEEMRRVGSGN